MALSAVDVALWDLKARLLGLPLVALLDRAHEEVPVYGSGGFTSYSLERLAEQLAGWVEEGIPRVKLKVGREPERERLDAVRNAVLDAALYVDANGAFSRKEALFWAERYAHDWASRGSRSPSLRPIWRASGCCGIAGRQGWTSPPASTASSHATS